MERGGGQDDGFGLLKTVKNRSYTQIGEND
jgi:hypothetical protein